MQNKASSFSWMLLLSAAVMLFAYSPSAHAGLWFEPYVGYHSGKWDNGNNCNTCSEDESGPSYGARLGIESLGFLFGVDGMSGTWTDKSSPNYDVTPTSIGPFLGYQFSSGIKFYGSYGIASNLKFDRSGSSYTDKGSDYKVGLGFHLLPLVALNLEYISATYTKDSNGNTLSPNVTSKVYGATLSIPLDW